MKRVPFVLLAAALAVALVPCAALAKGPSAASVDGPGLAEPITFGAWGEHAMAPGAPLMEFAEAAGFFPAVFPRRPDPMLRQRPKGDLGPRYVVEYTVPGPYDEEWSIEQDLYPYAKPNPVTYMARGQPIYHTHTRGGWFVATSPMAPPLLFQLTEAGLPRNPPGNEGSPFPWTAVGALAMAAALLVLGTAGVVRVRRRPGPATT